MKLYRKLWLAYSRKKNQVESIREALAQEHKRKEDLSKRLRESQLAVLNCEAEASRESSRAD